jgi:hypothetical protein
MITTTNKFQLELSTYLALELVAELAEERS